MLQDAFLAMKTLWRHWPGCEEPGLVLDTIDHLYPEGKPRPICVRQRREDYGWQMKFLLPPGVSCEKFLEQQNLFVDATRRYVEMDRLDSGYITLDIYEEVLRAVYPYNFQPGGFLDLELPVPIGWSVKGLYVFDLVAAPHMLIAGESGKGKSNFLHGLIRSLLPRACVVVLDLKRLEFSYLRDHILLARNEDEGLAILRRLEMEMERRFDILERAGVEKIQKYRGRMPYIVFVVDEFAEIQSQASLNIIDRLVRLARAVGISVVVATQHPSSEVIKGKIKSQFDARLCFRVADGVNSRMVLGEHFSMGAYLPADIPGRAIFRFGDTRLVQTMLYDIQAAKAQLPEVKRIELAIGESATARKPARPALAGVPGGLRRPRRGTDKKPAI